MKFRLVTTPAAKARHLDIAPVTVTIPSRPMRILDFDVECRPLSWISSDYVSKDITAIAWGWASTINTPPEAVTVHLLGSSHEYTPWDEQRLMLEAFLRVYNEADMVTGHYIRGFDLPTINGALMEHRLPALGDKLTCDTKLDFMRTSGMSLSQEAIGAMLKLDHQKVVMNQDKWRRANRLEPEGIEEARKRVAGDVRMHMEMRRELLKLGYLNAPKLWRSLSEQPLATYAP